MTIAANFGGVFPKYDMRILEKVMPNMSWTFFRFVLRRFVSCSKNVRSTRNVSSIVSGSQNLTVCGIDCIRLVIRISNNGGANSVHRDKALPQRDRLSTKSHCSQKLLCRNPTSKSDRVISYHLQIVHRAPVNHSRFYLK